MDTNLKGLMRQKQSECFVDFCGLISRRTCSSVAIELIKYILLQRDQIPESLDSLISQAKAQDQDENGQESQNPIQISEIGIDIEIHENNDRSAQLEQTCSSSVESLKLVKTTSGYCTKPCLRYDDDYCLQPLISKAEKQQSESLSHSPSHKHKLGSSVAVFRPLGPAARKKKLAVVTARKIFDNIHATFELSDFPIQKLALILGTSLVTPKETFVLNFPTNHIEGKDIPLDTVKKTLFRELVTSDFIESFSQPGVVHSLRKVYILLLANRNSDIKWFTPLPRYSLSTRNTTYNITLSNPGAGNTSMSVSNSSMLEISGVNPMELTINSPNVTELSSPFSSECKRRRLSNQTLDHTFDIEDVIWYQAPVTFQGFR